MGELGDISDFLKEGSVANLDWLEVNDAEYRELDRLPKQNLDFAPDLEAAWAHEDKPAAAYLVPNIGAPRAMADLSQAHGFVSEEVVAEQVVKVARMALMQSDDLQRVRHALMSRFDTGMIRQVREMLASTLRERGLLGRYYISASDFSGCHRSSKNVVAFVRRFASTAQFVEAKPDCAGCIHNASETCAVFQKKLVLEVPYTSDLAHAVERSQASKGKKLASTTQDPRERVREAYLAGDVTVAGPVATPKPIVNPVHQMRANKAPQKVHLPVLQNEQARLAQASQVWNPNVATGKVAANAAPERLQKKAADVTNLLRREMLRGRSEPELLQALKLSFSVEELRATRESWEPLFKTAGHFGTVYSHQGAFDNCHTGADFIAKHNSEIKTIVAGEKCGGCIYNKISRCLVYGKPLVASADHALTDEMVGEIVRGHKQAGRLGLGAESVAWGSTPGESLKAIYRTASTVGKERHAPSRYVEQAFRGHAHAHVTSGLTRREILRTASRYLNEGLYGDRLVAALRRQFASTDIEASRAELKTVLAEQGLQGIYYVDPTIYPDYAKSCDEGARLHRARLVPYVKMGSKCESCVHQPSAGFCSKYAKPLVIEPPYADKAAQQREMLASGEADQVNFVDLVNTNTSILAQFEMQKASTIELNPEPTVATVTVELGGVKFDL